MKASTNYSRFAFAQQLTVPDVAFIFQCDARTVRAAIKKTPPEITFYTKFGRVFFSPEDVMAAIALSKKHQVRNSAGITVATDVDKLWQPLSRLVERILNNRLKEAA